MTFHPAVPRCVTQPRDAGSGVVQTEKLTKKQTRLNLHVDVNGLKVLFMFKKGAIVFLSVHNHPGTE